MYSNLPTFKIHIHTYSLKPAKYQYKIHIHIYRCIIPNINVFNLPTLIIHTHTYTYIEPANFIIIFFFFWERTCQISIYSNLLTLKIHIHTYICNLPNIFGRKFSNTFAKTILTKPYVLLPSYQVYREQLIERQVSLLGSWLKLKHEIKVMRLTKWRYKLYYNSVLYNINFRIVSRH